MAASLTRSRRLATLLLIVAVACGVLLAVSMRFVVGVTVGKNHAAMLGAGSVAWVFSERSFGRVGPPGQRWGPLFIDRFDDELEWWPVIAVDAGESVWLAPLWMPLLVTGAPGLILAWKARFVRGHCRFCRYDLAGLAPDASCPECGRAQSRVTT